jgi:transcription elongation factor GreA
MFNQLTESDIKKMEEEIEYRKVVVRKEKLEAVKEARAQGDLSENFEYYAAKKDKNANERRIRYLDRMVRTANVISDASAEDEVGINNTVRVYFEDDEEEETYRIVTTVREDVLNGIISNISPMGKALLGHKVGDRVAVTPEKGEPFYVVIRSIENTVDESNSWIN